jgi:glutamate dehydrogenase (NAD(P)+)
MLVNGGGVTCSYFEWLKNIEHVAPGMMTKRFEEMQQKRMLHIMGYSDLDEHIKGADEVDIVYSALDGIMTNAVRNNWSYAVEHDMCFRDACLVNAINKVYQHIKIGGLQ